jgi:hypothetical protein
MKYQNQAGAEKLRLMSLRKTEAKARRQIGEPGFDLATRPLLPQHDGTALVLANEVK